MNRRMVKLSDLKESNPLEIAEFAFAMQIADEQALAGGWVGKLKKRDQNNSLVEQQNA